MRREKVITVLESVKIVQDSKDIILEKGDKFRIVPVKEEDYTLLKVAGIINNYTGIFNLKGPLEQEFGRGTVSFYNYSALLINQKRGQSIMIASVDNVDYSEDDVLAQDGKLVIGYTSM